MICYGFEREGITRMAEPALDQAQFETVAAVVRRLVADILPHPDDVTEDEPLVSVAGLKLAELDEVYFSALQELGRRPPLEESEVHVPVNLNDPTLDELVRHIAFNCPQMSEAEQQEVLRPDPTVTTQGDTGLEAAADEAAGPHRNRGLLGIAVLLAIVAIIAAAMLAMMD